MLNDGRCPGLGLKQDTRYENQGQRQQVYWVALLQLPSLLSDHGFESDRSTASTSSSVSSMSERSGGSRYSCCGQHPCWEPGGHMKINLPVFKDEDTKDAITYQSWCWDLTVYHWTRCRDCTLLPYAIRSLQSYPGELMRSSGMDITLDDALNILDEHYNNVKALDALNQELFQIHMGEKETVADWGVCLLRHLQILAASSFPDVAYLLLVNAGWNGHVPHCRIPLFKYQQYSGLPPLGWLLHNGPLPPWWPQ